MSGYTPKPGDRIRATKVHEVTVSKVTDDGQIVTTAGRWFHPEVFDIELVEAAPVPFVVGQPITPEMGQPPVGSVMANKRNAYMHYDQQGWVATNGYNEASPWAAFRRALEHGALTLLRLGDGSVS